MRARRSLGVKPRRFPPCAECPKYKLHPGPTRGLHPGNSLAVELYYKASREQRVGTMAGAFLVDTLPIEAAESVIRLHDHLFRDDLDRTTTLDKMLLINRIALEVKGEHEEKLREAAKLKS